MESKKTIIVNSIILNLDPNDNLSLEELLDFEYKQEIYLNWLSTEEVDIINKNKNDLLNIADILKEILIKKELVNTTDFRINSALFISRNIKI